MRCFSGNLFVASAKITNVFKAACICDLGDRAVGGINDTNIPDYIKAGVASFGVGTNIVDKKMLAADDYDGIRELAKRYVEVLK